MPGLPGRKVDIDFTLRRVFGKESFRFATLPIDPGDLAVN